MIDSEPQATRVIDSETQAARVIDSETQAARVIDCFPCLRSLTRTCNQRFKNGSE